MKVTFAGDKRCLLRDVGRVGAGWDGMQSTKAGGSQVFGQLSARERNCAGTGSVPAVPAVFCGAHQLLFFAEASERSQSWALPAWGYGGFSPGGVLGAMLAGSSQGTDFGARSMWLLFIYLFCLCLSL